MLSRVSAAILLLAAVLSGVPAAAQVLYVDQDATGPDHDGTSWCTAFTHLHEALVIALSGTTVRIAEGRYLPDVTGLPEPREATFSLPGGLTVIGGYAGCGASDPDERDPRLYVTELSGDLAGDDPGGHIADNAYHVITASGLSQTTMLGGLVIRGGNTQEEGLGGGILAESSRLVLSVCDLAENRAWRGGAIYIDWGELHLFQCQFVANQTTGEGGAIFQAAASLEAHNCLFAGQQAGSDGGAIFSDLGSANFFNCTFGDNHSDWHGGAIYDYVAVTTTAANCIFWGNRDESGSGEGSQIFLNPTNSLYIDFSCVQGWTGAFGGEGNIGEDPDLVDLSGGDLHLRAGSPCIDAGSNDLVTAQLDLDGNPRIAAGRVDMGCYEFQGISGAWPLGPSSWPAGILQQNFPNPFNPQTTIRYSLPEPALVHLKIFDLAGRVVRVLVEGEVQGPGQFTLDWDGADHRGQPVSSGTYFYQLKSGDFQETRGMVVIR